MAKPQPRTHPKLTTTLTPDAAATLERARLRYPGVPTSVLVSRLILSGNPGPEKKTARA
jgi:hypothetical protein